MPKEEDHTEGINTSQQRLTLLFQPRRVILFATKMVLLSFLFRAQFEIGDDFAQRGHYGSSVGTYVTIYNAHDVLPAIQF